MTLRLFPEKWALSVLFGLPLCCLVLVQMWAGLNSVPSHYVVVNDFDSMKMRPLKNAGTSLTATELDSAAIPASADEVVFSSGVSFPNMTITGEKTTTTPYTGTATLITDTRPKTRTTKKQIRNKLDQYFYRHTNIMSRTNNPELRNLLSFSILGFAKTATTFLLRDWFPLHPQICLPEEEACYFGSDVPHIPYEVQMVQALLRLDHVQSKQDNRINSKNVTLKKTTIPHKQCLYRGFKCPTQILEPEASVRNLISKWWPKAKLIVCVRHPVLWFQSFYNFRIRDGLTLPPAQQLVGSGGDNCQSSHDVCTEHAKFHIYLARLGKTRLDTPHERSLLQLPPPRVVAGQSKKRKGAVPNPIFLIESSQIDTDNDNPVNGNLTDALQKDLTRFLKLPLDAPLPPVPRRLERNVIPPLASTDSKRNTTKEYSLSSSALGGGAGGKQPKVAQLNICNKPYQALRRELVEIGKNASQWILQYFLQAPGVHVSSRAYLERQLKDWQLDPCDKRNSDSPPP